MVLGDGIERNGGVTLSIESNCVTIYIIFYTQSRGFFKTCKSSSSRVPDPSLPRGHMYSHRAVSGNLPRYRISAKKVKKKKEKNERLATSRYSLSSPQACSTQTWCLDRKPN